VDGNRRTFGKDMWTAGLRHSWRKMEMAAEGRANWRRQLSDVWLRWERHTGIRQVKSVVVEKTSESDVTG